MLLETWSGGELDAPPDIHVEPDYREIVVGARGQYVARVSPEDYIFLIRWRWTFKVSRGGNVYARRCTWTGSVKDGSKRKVTILMHNVIMERKGEDRPSPEHTADHRNCRPLDNRRVNLRWADKSGQAKNQRRKRRA